MKIAIATVFRNTNYGAVLQAYASSTIISSISNKECYLIDYRREKAINMFRFSIFDVDAAGNKRITKKSIKRTIKQFLNPMGTIIRFNRFEDFRERNMNISKQVYYHSNDINLSDTDIMFLGSDQIWNPDITDGFDDVYFGKIGNKNIFTISYAPSFGKTNFSESEKSKLKGLLDYVDFISVREEEGVDILREIVDRPITCVPDPTVLVDKKIWEDLAYAKRKEHNKYIMVYMLYPDENVINLARTISKLFNYKIVLFDDGTLKGLNDMKSKKNYEPSEFLSYLKGAEYVVTNSFHGTIFSVIFNKKFFTVPHKTRGDRMINFCRKVGLENRIIYDAKQVDKEDIVVNIDYECVNLRLDELKEVGLTYIENALKGVIHG